MRRTAGHDEPRVGSANRPYLFFPLDGIKCKHESSPCETFEYPRDLTELATHTDRARNRAARAGAGFETGVAEHDGVSRTPAHKRGKTGEDTSAK